MVRGKTQMKRIENNSSRQVAFSKRRNGILKKAFELSVLCDVEVALIIFSPTGKLFEFASCGISKTIERYQKHLMEKHGGRSEATEENVQKLKEEAVMLEKKIKKLLGDDLEACSLWELQQLENKVEKGLYNIRARKNTLFNERIQQLKHEETSLLEENAELKGKFMPPVLNQRRVLREDLSNVETQLSIGLPKTTSYQHWS
ncbi:hypothetical protein Nepgr_011290 [Nepenthes gracilis]|uniref:Uncharacterized protein n=1 Tax=Nepenthes gracilis TaxID=150966 RepID=A0AAD3XM61_NEPGR|nr:hypothetical protein Nepgr_011290 [Nepenthes gracilis]